MELRKRMHENVLLGYANGERKVQSFEVQSSGLGKLFKNVILNLFQDLRF